jgi:uncharacterized protein (TIGR03067 family)
MKMLMVAAVSLVVSSADPPTLSTSKELKQLQGEWVLQGGEKNGTKLELEQGDPKIVLEIRGDKWIFMGQEKGKIIAIDSRNLDTKSSEEGRVGEVDEGIYKLNGDTLTICYYQGKGKKRPTEFASKDDDTILVVLKRPKR